MNPEMMFLQYRISLLFLLAFLVCFLSLRENKKRAAVYLIACYAITGGMDYLFFFTDAYHGIPVFHTLAEIVVIQAVPFLISKYRDFRAMFVGFTAAAYVLTGNIACTMMYLLGTNMIVNIICQCAIHLILLGLLIWRIRESFLDSQENAKLQWGAFCLIPALFYTAVYASSMWPANIYEQPENLLGVVAILVLMVVSYIMIFQTFANARQEEDQRRSLVYLENYANRLKSEADLLQEKEMEAAVMRHDLRHYSILINSCLEEGREEEIRELLKAWNEQIAASKTVRYCENLAVNSIVAHCAKRAQELGLRFEADIEIPQKMSVNEFEFATVVSNLLENAIDAAAEVSEESRRFVKITAGGVKDKLILNITNGFEKEPRISRITGLPVSEGGRGHGYGMQSVRAFAKKTEAVFDFQTTDHIFSAKLLFSI